MIVKTSRQPGYLTILVILLAVIVATIISACGGGEPIAVADPADAVTAVDDGGKADDGIGEESESAGGVLGGRPVQFQIDGAVAFLRQDSAQSLQPTVEELATNFWVMTEGGDILPGIVATGYGSLTIELERIDVAPTGEIYLLFVHGLDYAGGRCRWFIIGLKNIVACAEQEYRFAVSEVRFNNVGNVFYRNDEGELRRRDRENGTVATLLTAVAIGLDMNAYLPLDDGSVLVNGDLAGTRQRLFRFVPGEEAGEGWLETMCVQSFAVSTRADMPRDQYFLASDGSVYFKRKGDACAGMESAYIYHGFLADDGEFVSTALPGMDGVAFAEDSRGHVYAIGDSWDFSLNDLTDLTTGEVIGVGLKETELFQVRGDFIYTAGTDFLGDNMLMRRSLISGEEAVLYATPDGLVQEFAVSANGDVHFGVLSYTDLSRRLYRYVAGTGVTDDVVEMAGDLSNIVLVDGVSF